MARAFDNRFFRGALCRFTTGVIVLSTGPRRTPHAMTANAFMSGSLEPPLVVVSVGRKARMHARLRTARRFGVSILAEAQEPASRHFAGQAVPGFTPAFGELAGVPVLAQAAGSAGMVGGQAIDLAAAGRVKGATPVLDGHALEDMHLRKTGALIRAACTLGGIMTGAAGHDIAAIDDYARALGLAFQIIDDVLDVEGSNAALGKTAGKDAASGKPTFPALYGVAGSRARASASVDRAIAAVSGVHLGGRLVEIAQWSLARTH